MTPVSISSVSYCTATPLSETTMTPGRDRSQELNVQGHHWYKASADMSVRLDVDLEPDFVDVLLGV